MTALSRARGYAPFLVQFVQTQSTFDNVKNFLFAYVVATYLRRFYRHIRARGVRGSVIEVYQSIARVSAEYS